MAASATPEPCVRLPGCRVDLLECGPASVELHFDGRLTFRQIYAAWPEVRGLIGGDRRRVCFDLSRVDDARRRSDRAAARAEERPRCCGISADIVGARGGVQRMLELYGSHPPRSEPAARRRSPSASSTRSVATPWASSTRADPSTSSATSPSPGRRGARPRSVNWPDVPRVDGARRRRRRADRPADQLPGRLRDGVPGARSS